MADARLGKAGKRIGDGEERVQGLEGASCEFIKHKRRPVERLVDQQGRASRENIRLRGVQEGAKDKDSVGAFC